MARSIFISYRRADSQHATFAIADRLRWAFGVDEVFFDRGSIRAGNEWPVSLKDGLQAAKALVVVMGKAWLTTTDDWGRRRIDDSRDWVRLEIITGLARRRGDRLLIIPVLLSGARRLQSGAVDAPLQDLAQIEPLSLNDDNWEDGIERLIAAIAEGTDLRRNSVGDSRNPNGSPARPLRTQAGQSPMSDAEVREALEPLARWQLQRGPHPWGVAGQAQEISKSYDFESFARAINFMASASREIDAWKPPHHPRWENQWKVVTVWFSTWDVDCRVTKLDIEAARKLDDFYARWNRLN